MKCLQCRAENMESLSQCAQCGAPLPVIRRRGIFRRWGAVLTALLLLAGIAGLAHIFRDDPLVQENLHQPEAVSEEAGREKDRAERREGSPALTPGKQPADSSGRGPLSSRQVREEVKIVPGWVTIVDSWGREVRKVRAGVAGKGWLALPSRACLGGNRWYFTDDRGRRAEISGGLWIMGDRAGLWHAAGNGAAVHGPPLASWNPDMPVSWRSFESSKKYDSLRLRPGRREGFFVSASMPRRISEGGIFVQDGSIVGWSFGPWLQEAVMWPAGSGDGLQYRAWVSSFYDLTFAHGREEKFAAARAMGANHSVIDRLAAFRDGFRLEPKLADADTPRELLPEEIVKEMRALVDDAVLRGEGQRVASLLDGQALKRIGDMDLLIDIIHLLADARGVEEAIREIEDTGIFITRKLGYDAPALTGLHVRLYQEWLQTLIAHGDVYRGWQAHSAAKSFFPDDPAVHLAGVEFALMDGDWQRAESLLFMKDYPPAFQDRAELLALRIAALKGQENRIVIPFPGGSHRVMVTAGLNNSTFQEFLVDTGASVVTIPSSTADALGLETIHDSRIMSTASDIMTVREVMIDAIEIDGWTEYDVRAAVLDMPDQPGLGLLGLNYLSRFRMDMKPDEGVLMLTPR
ncbi:MAG: retropepsin-like domain-containing protein [Nitrospiraceae bacterium]|nr:MAG: retropepsin-like domain-containing protein [Nitrospiraceae bacterium]